MNISRRDFLKGAASGAMALGLSTIGNIGAYAEDEKKSGRWSWDTIPEKIVNFDKRYDCDVLILGAGSAGVPAAMFAAAKGAKTIVMQKGATIETNGATIAAFNTIHDEEYGLHYDPVATRAKFSKYHQGRADINVLCSVIDNSGPSLDWLTNAIADEKPVTITPVNLLQNPEDECTHLIYYWGDWTTRTLGFMSALSIMRQRAEENGAEFLFSTPAEQFITNDEGDVIGAVGKNADGEYVAVYASKGVLLATGDITDDEEMVEYYCPTNLGVQNCSPFGTCTGDGHKMAMWIGAKMDVPPLCLGMCNHSRLPGASEPFLRVNLAGKRFINETIGSDEVYSTQPLWTAEALQPGHMDFQIIDSKNIELAEKLDQWVGKYNVSNGVEMKDNTVFKANTLEELADAIGVDKEPFLETIARYNEICKTGEDLDYGVPAEILEGCSIEEGPFYAVQSKPQNMALIGGVQGNSKLQVLSKDGKVIKGLYAAGNCLGACYGYQYPWIGFAASNKMHAMAGGMLAVKNMLELGDDAFSF